MRQLDACDFCGDAADGVYEVVPAAVAGESRRLALCTDCRGTLQSVLDPLLDAADGGTSTADSTDSEPEAASTSGPTAGDAATERAPSPAADDDGTVIDAGGTDSNDETVESDEQAADKADDAETEPRPDGYAQVIRLLQNRDGAMPREDLRALATNAYGLGDREFDEVVDAAVENGDLEESAGGLRTT